MESMETRSFNSLVEQFLGIPLPQQMAEPISFPELAPDTQDFIMRMLTLMKRAGYSATGFSPVLIRWLSATIPSILPSAWGGRIPPLTLPDRHKKLDAYVTNQNWITGKSPPIFVDMGCGFPPVTSADTARKLTDWDVYGVDRSFAEYVLYDIDGHYACFDQNGVFQYFQALMNLSGRALYADPDATRNQFIRLFEDLFPLIENSNGIMSETVEKKGSRLIRNHIRDFEMDNLTLIRSDIKELKLPPAKVIRCMNVLIYFKPKIRKKMLLQTGGLLDDDGILIAGTNGLGIQSRYTVYKKGTDGIFPSEFAFSLDNLGHIVFMPWFTIHEDDPEATLLAQLTGAIRSDNHFWTDFSNRIDELMQHHGACERGSDGFLHFPDEEISPREYFKKHATLWRQLEEEGYLGDVVDILKRIGYDARINSVGDVAIRPVSDF